ncbi:ABC transporter ATP-binding protein [Candidatus Bealeia paramacronuclearis]|uniref:ABC transporter ATP-binding protein n=1 Tax=Candidatus Bealeia paramacronuclearis TaxID=1921001 RepID=A0ABZ2C6F5_9PROT|nr:ABC transporter ATP-binding protein [Candidatus Bealeia paramacronuclearis]
MISLQNLSRRFGDRYVFKDVNYRFPEKARIALVGANGAGKTTLLNILCKLDDPDDGDVIRPGTLRLGYLPQEPNPTPKETILEEALSGAGEVYQLHHDLHATLHGMETHYSDTLYEKYEKIEKRYQDLEGYALEADAKAILVGLGFHHAQFELHPKSLSGGWRMRLELAKMLMNRPNFLVLDEPTNHLDLPSMIWLEDYLQDFTGTLVFVSHDRALLNRLSNNTLHLKGGTLTAYKGNFDAFLEAFELKNTQNEQMAKNLQSRSQEIEKFVSRFRAKPSKARQVQSRLKMLEKIKVLEDSIDFNSPDAEVAIPLKKPQPSGRVALTVTDLAVGYAQPLVKKIGFRVERGQKIAIIGANGIGKSTLLKTIAGKIPPLEGEFKWGHNVEMRYFAQEQLDVFDPKRTALENLMSSAPNLSEQKARRLLGALLLKGDDVFKPIRVLSGGEKSRVGLASLLSQDANLLLLDEPTNHLDMASSELLAQALDEFEGTVIFVSHNRTFIDSVATHILAISAKGHAQLFEGQIEDYVHHAALRNFPNVLKGEE